MANTDKTLLRKVIRRVHPDLFNNLPFERSHNSDNLKLLNQYIEDLAAGRNPAHTVVSFWVRGELQLELVDARLTGSLAGLYLAFGLISADELTKWEAVSGLPPDDTNFLQWLHETVQDAVACADEHEQRKKLVRELKATIEFKYGLQAVRVGNTYSSTTVDLARQLECLRVFEAFLTDAADQCHGLSFHLYHPWNAPSQTYSWQDEDAAPRLESSVMNAHVAADGTMHVIADRATLRSQIESLNLEHARILARVNGFWGRRQRDLTPQVCEVLAVQNVWCDNRSAESQEAFVLWAGRVLNAAPAFLDVLEGRRFNFSVLVHSDEASPLIDYMATSSVLQVRSDCAVQVLQEFLCSETADEADSTAVHLYKQEDEEAAKLEQVRAAFGAKHVIRVCSSEHKASALAAADRLLAHAERIRAQVDLTNASIAIDDCYQIWESGFISIPHTFEVADLGKTLPQLLPSFSMASSGGDRMDTSRLDTNEDWTPAGESASDIEGMVAEESNGASNGGRRRSWWGGYEPQSMDSTGSRPRSEQAMSSAPQCVASKPMQTFHVQVSRRRAHVPAAPKPWMSRRSGLR